MQLMNISFSAHLRSWFLFLHLRNEVQNWDEIRWEQSSNSLLLMLPGEETSSKGTLSALPPLLLFLPLLGEVSQLSGVVRNSC